MAAMNALSWLFIGFCCFSVLIISHGVEAYHPIYPHLQSVQAISVDPTYKTGYHLQPYRNWMSDPDAPMVYNGVYHLFYQWNTNGSVWGNIVWAHATSTDLVNWIHHKQAIYPSESFDINGCWSGSATIVEGKPIIQYTGIIESNQWNYQVQDMAVPKNLSDPYLVEWLKPEKLNPVIKPSNGINASAFRDPTSGWQGPDGIWRLTIGGKVGNDGISYLFRSHDFIHWTKDEKPFHRTTGTGRLECIDFFPVAVGGEEGLDTSVVGPGVKHVFKISLDEIGFDYYTVGSYNPETDDYTPDEGSIDNQSGLRVDYGKFYASKTFFDNVKKRRILWGLVKETSSVEANVKKGWSGIQAFPRTLLLTENGKQLKQWPVEEIKQLRTKRVSLHRQILRGGSVVEVSGVTASQADVDVKFDLPRLVDAEIMNSSWVDPQQLCSSKPPSVKGKSGPFGLLALASKNFEEQTAIFFRVFNRQNSYVVLMCSDQRRSSLDKSNENTTYGAFVDVDPHCERKLSLRSLIDRSIVESFGVSGKVVIAARAYPTLALDNEARLYVFNNGTKNVKMSSLEAWSMKKAEIKNLEELKISENLEELKISDS